MKPKYTYLIEVGEKKKVESEISAFIGAPGTIRTCDTRIRNPVLYPLSYGG